MYLKVYQSNTIQSNKLDLKSDYKHVVYQFLHAYVGAALIYTKIF